MPFSRLSNPPTAEDVKEVIRRYAEQNLPGRACAGVTIRVGDGPDLDVEELLVLPTPPACHLRVASPSPG